MPTMVRRRSLITALLVLICAPPHTVRGPDLAAFDPEDEVVTRPPTGVGSGSGTFDSLGAAITVARSAGTHIHQRDVGMHEVVPSEEKGLSHRDRKGVRYSRAGQELRNNRANDRSTQSPSGCCRRA